MKSFRKNNKLNQMQQQISQKRIKKKRHEKSGACFDDVQIRYVLSLHYNSSIMKAGTSSPAIINTNFGIQGNLNSCIGKLMSAHNLMRWLNSNSNQLTEPICLFFTEQSSVLFFLFYMNLLKCHERFESFILFVLLNTALF